MPTPAGRKHDITIFREQIIVKGTEVVIKYLPEALDGLKEIAQNTKDDRLKADIYEYMIDRVLGKSNQRVDVSAQLIGTIEVKPLTADEKMEILRRVTEKYAKNANAKKNKDGAK